MKRLLILPLLLLVAIPASAQCDLSATPANFAAQVGAAQTGQTVCMASGTYATLPAIAKAGMITIQPASGATVQMSGGQWSAQRNMTLKGVKFTSQVDIRPPNGKMNITLDGVDFGNISVNTNQKEGRLSIIQGGGAALGANGVKVMNSNFGPGGCSDGIQDSSSGTEIGPGNYFHGITQGNCAPLHVDPIQLYASNYANVHDNLLYGNEQGIMSPDGISRGYNIVNNVIQTATNYECMHLGDTRDGTVKNNACVNGGIRVYGGNQNVPSQNMTIQNNAAPVNNGGCTNCTITNNARATSYMGTDVTMRCSFATKTPTGTGTGGTTVGLNDCGTPPPPEILVTVAPATVSLNVNGTQQFTPTVTGTTNTAVTWTTDTGTVSSTGFYTAPATATTSTVRATSVADTSKFGTANITVTATPPPPTFPAPGKCLVTKFTANIRGTAVNNGFGPVIGSAPLGASGCIVSVTTAVIPNSGGATWVQVDFNDPVLPTGYIGSDNMTESTAPPPPPTLVLSCPAAKTGFTGSNIPSGSTLTITGSIPGASPVSCTIAFP